MKYFVVRETGSYINNKNDLGGDWNMYIYHDYPIEKQRK